MVRLDLFGGYQCGSGHTKWDMVTSLPRFILKSILVFYLMPQCLVEACRSSCIGCCYAVCVLFPFTRQCRLSPCRIARQIALLLSTSGTFVCIPQVLTYLVLFVPTIAAMPQVEILWVYRSSSVSSTQLLMVVRQSVIQTLQSRVFFYT